MSDIVIVDLLTYPLKGGRAVSHNTIPVDVTGLRGDRRFMLVDPNGTFVTQRQCPELALVAFEHTTPAKNAVRISVPAGETDWTLGEIESPEASAVGEIPVRVWKDTVNAILQDPRISNELSTFLDRDVRLVYMPDAAKRLSRGQIEDGSEVVNSFADGYPILLTSTESLAALNHKLRQKSQPEVPMNRFRPNIVVEGCDAFDEDFWQNFSIGSLRFHGMKRCGRCVVTTIDQDTGERENNEPFDTLGVFRKFGTERCFGMNVNHVGLGVLSVGQNVRVTQRGPPRIAAKGE